MPTTAGSFLRRAPFPSRPRPPPLFAARPMLLCSPLPRLASFKPRLPVLVASFDELDARGKSHRRSSKNLKSILSNLIQEVEPLDASLIQKDVPANTVDAMKRTISGMLGLLPSDQFHVLVEAFWDPLFKLLVSSMMTGYTLRNAEYRLFLERNLDIDDEHTEKRETEIVEDDSPEKIADRTTTMFNFSLENDLLPNLEKNEDPKCENVGVEALGKMTPKAQEYILYLQSRLKSVKKELHDIKKKNSALQMQQFVGENNDLLDYLRSLQPEKVVELSETSSPGVDETIHSVVHGLLATLSPKMHSVASEASPQSGMSDNATGEALNIGKDDCPELVENASLRFQPHISVSRDYLARLLFWCMLLGHYLRGLEYRLELMQLLTISTDTESASHNGDHVA